MMPRYQDPYEVIVEQLKTVVHDVVIIKDEPS